MAPCLILLTSLASVAAPNPASDDDVEKLVKRVAECNWSIVCQQSRVAVVLEKKNHPSLQQIFAACIVPCEDRIDQNSSPLSKCFWGLFEKVSGHFVITTGFPICHSTNIARKLSKCHDGISDGLA